MANKTNEKIALIDGDGLVYSCGFAAEKTRYLVSMRESDDILYHGEYDTAREAKAYMEDHKNAVLWSRKEYEPIENCLHIVKTAIEGILDATDASEYRVYLSGRHNFRDDIFPDYKANRDGASRPRFYKDIRNYLVGKWDASVCDGFEADDAIGIDACELGNCAIVVSLDKDLDQIPGAHYNWSKRHSYTVSPKEGMMFFYNQMLTGDATDNIQGIHGIGPVTATKMLAECKAPKDAARVVYSKYTEAGHGADHVDTTAALLWIWRKHDDEHPFWTHLGYEN